MNMLGTAEYIDGLIRMAVACSKGIHPSYMRAECYWPRYYREAFAVRFRFSVNKLALEPAEPSLERIFMNWMGPEDAEIAESLAWLVERRLGKTLRLYEATENRGLLDALGGYEDSPTGFTTVDDLVFAEFKEITVCFLLGNNE